MIAVAALLALPIFAQLSPREAESRAAISDAGVYAAIATEREREAALQGARMAPIPHVVGSYALSPQAAANDAATVEQHLFFVGAGINVSELFSSSSAIRTAASELLAAQRDVESAQFTARSNVLKLYFNALQTIAIDELRARAVSAAQRDVDVARLRIAAGDAPSLDRIRAGVALSQAKAASYRANADRANAVDALAWAAKVPPESLNALTASTAEPAQQPQVTDAVARALAHRPELDSLLRAAQARQNAVAAARAASLPAATIEAGYASGVDTGVHVGGAQVTAQVDVPIGTSASYDIGAARARAQAAYAALTAERGQITLDVTAAVRDANADDLAVVAAEQARRQAAAALAAVQLGYRNGASSGLDLAEAQRTYQQAAVDALTARYQQAQAHWYVELVAP
ncbi:MAG TPA: TolC family protein [Candidatus Tumulicola sp.]